MIEIPDFSKTLFLYPQYFWYVWAAAAAVYILFVIYSLRIAALHRKFGGYKHARLLAGKAKTGIDGLPRLVSKTALMALLALLLGLTMLSPKIKETQTENEYEPAQIVIALDSTISMLAEDVAPSRIVAAKNVIYRLLDRLRKEGSKDGVGLIRYTDIAIPAVIIPTKYYNLIEYELKLTNRDYLKMFESHGSNAWDAVTQGLVLFDYNNNDQEKILILIGDGEQIAESEYIDKTRKEAMDKRLSESKLRGVKIFLVSVGVGDEETLIPKEKDSESNTQEFYAQSDGRLITSKPDPAYMEEMANLIGGELKFSENQENLESGLNDILNTQRKVIGQKENVNLKDLSPWFIGATLVLLFFVPIVKLGN